MYTIYRTNWNWKVYKEIKVGGILNFCLPYHLVIQPLQNSHRYVLAPQKRNKRVGGGGDRQFIRCHFQPSDPPLLENLLFLPAHQPVFLNVYGAQESIPRNEFRQAM